MNGGPLRSFRREVALLFTSLLVVAPTEAAEWTQYRGPNHDGTSSETIRLNWREQPPRLLWKVALTPGLSSLSIAGGRVFTQVRRSVGGNDTEFCVALNADTGTELWSVPLDVADYPNGGVGFDDGPRSTPAVDGNRVYVFTSYLRLFCLDAATGQQIWKRDFVAEFGSNVVPWQNAASPVIAGDLVFVNGNATGQRFMALKKQDGSIVWKAHDDRMTQATPVFATIAGAPQVIFFTQSGLVSVRPDNGGLLWRYPFPFSTSTAASPVVAGDIVYCSAAYGSGAGAVRVSASGSGLTATEVWRTPGANMNHWATPVHYQGHLYGIYGQGLASLRCIDLATGREKWRQGGVGLGGVLLVNDHLLVSEDGGELWLATANPEAYTEVTRFQAVRGKTWNVPAISNGRIYIRSTIEAAAYDVSVPQAPRPKLKLQLDASRGASPFGFFITNEDGSAVSADRVPKIQVFATPDLNTGASGWRKVDVPPTFVGGHLRLDDVREESGGPQQFYRVVEQP